MIISRWYLEPKLRERCVLTIATLLDLHGLCAIQKWVRVLAEKEVECQQVLEQCYHRLYHIQVMLQMSRVGTSWDVWDWEPWDRSNAIRARKQAGASLHTA